MRIVAALTLSVLAASAQAAFQTTVDYPGVPPSGEVVGPFDTYDFAPGALALQFSGPIGPGTGVSGAFQSFVTAHQLNSANLTSQLNTAYEVTVYGTFTGVITAYNPLLQLTSFKVTGGSFALYHDPSQNHNFTGAGSGFVDGTAILNGTINSGSGAYSSLANAGFSIVLSGFTPVTPYFSPFPPGGESIFGLSTGSLPTGATGVGSMTHPDVLVGADGNLTFVPVPAAAWLLASGVLAGFGLQRRSRQVKAI